MRKMIFISRHAPSAEQLELAQQAGYELVHVGDVDGFDFEAVSSLLARAGAFTQASRTTVCVANVAVALNVLRVLQQYNAAAPGTAVSIGCWENAQRPTPEGNLTFCAKALHVWTVRLGGEPAVIRSGGW